MTDLTNLTVGERRLFEQAYEHLGDVWRRAGGLSYLNLIERVVFTRLLLAEVQTGLTPTKEVDQFLHIVDGGIDFVMYQVDHEVHLLPGELTTDQDGSPLKKIRAALLADERKTGRPWLTYREAILVVQTALED